MSSLISTAAFLYVLFLIAVVIIGPVITLLAWNCFMPLVWHAAPHLGYWSALALNVLLSIAKTPFTFSLNNKE